MGAGVRDAFPPPMCVWLQSLCCDGKKYNPQGGSLLAYIITQGRKRCTCQPCAIESITPMGYGHTAWFGGDG